MRVVTSEMPHTRSVSIGLYVGVGSRNESDDIAGISHLVEHLVFKGTSKRPAALDISGSVEGVGGVINAGTEQEMTAYWCKLARPYLEMGLDLLVDMLRNSLYDPPEIERERLVVLEEQKMINDSPSYKVDSLLDELLWPEHPLGRDISGTEASISGITRDMLLSHVSQSYTPSNMVLSVAGAVDHDHVVRQMDSLCEGWVAGSPPHWDTYENEQSEPRFCLEYRGIEQAHLAIGLPGLPLAHPDRYALDLLSVALGEGMSSRLFLEVREKRGLAYDVSSATTYLRDCGAFVVTAGVDPKRVHGAVETILAEVSALRDGLPEPELDKAKRLSTGRLLMAMEDSRAVASWMGTQEMLTGHVLDVDQVIDQVNDVATDDVFRVSNNLLGGQVLNMALVGPLRGQARLRRLLKF